MPRGKELYEDGGEVVKVEVTVNGKLVYMRNAAITGDGPPDGIRRYVTDNGEVINFRRERGYVELAKLML